jgi:cell division protein FtsB
MTIVREFITELAIPKKLFVIFFISFAAILYFSSYAIFGNKGIIKYFQLSQQLHEKDLVKNSLYNKMQDKKVMVNAMSIDSLDFDLLDEQVRKNLGYASKNEVIIYDNKSAN